MENKPLWLSEHQNFPGTLAEADDCKIHGSLTLRQFSVR